MAPPYIYLIQMTDSPVARGDRYIFQLDVHVVFGWSFEKLVSN